MFALFCRVFCFAIHTPSFMLWLSICGGISYGICSYATHPLILAFGYSYPVTIGLLYFVFRAIFRWEQQRDIKAYIAARREEQQIGPPGARRPARSYGD